MVDVTGPGLVPSAQIQTRIANISDTADLSPSQQIEKLLWTEMLKYSGLEEAFSSQGGEGSSAFARYMVEAIAEDIARTQPLGFEAKIDSSGGQS